MNQIVLRAMGNIIGKIVLTIEGNFSQECVMAVESGSS